MSRRNGRIAPDDGDDDMGLGGGFGISAVDRGASIGQGEEVNNSSINLFKVLLKTEFLTSLRDDRVSKEALLDEVSDFILRKGKLVTALLVSNWAKEMEKAQLARKRSGNGYGASSVVGRTPLAKRRSVDNAAFFPSYDRKRGLDSGRSATGGPSDVPLDAYEIQRTKAEKPADRRSDEILGHQDKPNSTGALSPPAIANSPPEKGEGGAAFSFRTSTKQASITQLSEEERREAIVEDMSQELQKLDSLLNDPSISAGACTKVTIAFLFLFVYLVVGTAAFVSYERQAERDRFQHRQNRYDLINKTVGPQCAQIYGEVQPVVDNRYWDIASSFFFCITIVSTVGYGKTAPKTSGGRGFCVFYAFLGIPLFNYFLMKFNTIIMGVFTFTYRQCCRGQRKWTTYRLIVFPTLIVFAIFLGGFVYQYSEGWSQQECMYFSFITLSTIGFGDLVPETSQAQIACCIYCLFFMGSMTGTFQTFQKAIEQIISKILRLLIQYTGIGKHGIAIFEERMNIRRSEHLTTSQIRLATRFSSANILESIAPRERSPTSATTMAATAAGSSAIIGLGGLGMMRRKAGTEKSRSRWTNNDNDESEGKSKPAPTQAADSGGSGKTAKNEGWSSSVNFSPCVVSL
mmetsp:Transcript_1111/g.1788  ORF Transcript_1111/g.1788 Transcript_1111/m.1788 type:complete len:631 (+) Transcript_1111:133-2025(+)